MNLFMATRLKTPFKSEMYLMFQYLLPNWKVVESLTLVALDGRLRGLGQLNVFCAVNFLSDRRNLVLDGGLQVVEELEVGRRVAGRRDGTGQICRTLASLGPVSTEYSVKSAVTFGKLSNLYILPTHIYDDSSRQSRSVLKYCKTLLQRLNLKITCNSNEKNIFPLLAPNDH